MLELRPTCENCNAAIPSGYLGAYPANTTVKYCPVDATFHRQFAAQIKSIPPKFR